MQKRVYKSMMLLAFLSIVSTALLLNLGFYNFFTGQMKKEVQSQAWLFEKNLDYVDRELDYLEVLNLSPAQDRVTLIAPDGQVLYDSYRPADLMENHLDRPEIGMALSVGWGEDRRLSATLGEETYYYALLLKDGNILRLAKTNASIYGVFTEIVPFIVLVTILIFLIAIYISVRLTRRILAPINQIDLTTDRFDKDVYEELTPFIRTIDKQQQRIREQLLDLENRASTIKTITDNMQEGLILLDTEEKILSANNSALRFCSSSMTDCAGQNILILTRNMDLLNRIRMALKGVSSTLMLEMGTQQVQVFVNPVWQGEQIQGVIVLFLDISAQAQAEKVRREFSANVSHELKTPLTTILGYADLIHTGLAKEQDVLKFVGKIKTEVVRLIGLIEAIIRLSELDEGTELKQQKESFDLNQLLAEVIERLKPLAEEKAIEMVASDTALTIHANRAMIEELLFNLIDNAIKYNKSGGRVEICVEQAGTQTKIIVSDSGIGIPVEHLERIFERFYRVDRSRSKKTGGSGLGLSIVKHIAQYHHGSVAITSEEGWGTQVTVVLN